MGLRAAASGPRMALGSVRVSGARSGPAGADHSRGLLGRSLRSLAPARPRSRPAALRAPTSQGGVPAERLERTERRRQGIAQMLLGDLTEQRFEQLLVPRIMRGHGLTVERRV